MEQKKITSLRITKKTKEDFKKMKEYPRETDEETLKRLISLSQSWYSEKGITPNQYK